MKRITCTLIIMLGILMVWAPQSQADGTFKFKETYKQKVVWDTWFDWWTTMDFGQIKINAKVPITEADTSQFDKKTIVWITMGDDEYGTRFSFYSDLGEGGYGAGGNSAYYSFSEVDWEGRRHEYLWITLKWNKKWLKVKVAGITEPYGFLSSILAYDYYWEDIVGPISKDLWANITIGEKSQDFYMNCTGVSTMKTKKKSWDEFDVYKVKVAGTGY